MAINKYFQGGIPAANRNESDLVYRMIDEAISIAGVSVYYVPRTLVSVDFVFTEDRLSTFNNAYQFEMYLENTQGYDGDGSFLSKFDIQIQSTCAFTVSRRKWSEIVGNSGNSILSNRPVEGDIIFFPLTNSMFEIKKVDHLNTFYQFGKLYTYRLDCELFQYSSERFNTGVTQIDSLEGIFSLSEGDYRIDSEDSFILTDESGCGITQDDYLNGNTSQNNIFGTESETVLDFTTSPFGSAI